VARKLDGNWLDARLRAAGSNRSGLSKALGKDRSAVTRIVSGARQIKLAEIETVAAHLGCSRDEVVKWAKAATPEQKPGFGEMTQAQFEAKEIGPESQPPAEAGMKKHGRHPAFGALKGMITILPGVDLTKPAFEDWKSLYDEE
jgi:hypothetical protein